jgi:hypothetical protein
MISYEPSVASFINLGEEAVSTTGLKAADFFLGIQKEYCVVVGKMEGALPLVAEVKAVASTLDIAIPTESVRTDSGCSVSLTLEETSSLLLVARSVHLR